MDGATSRRRNVSVLVESIVRDFYFAFRLLRNTSPCRLWLWSPCRSRSAIGLAVGIAGGFAGSRFIMALLYQVQPTDASSVALPLVSILSAAALSALVPALRAIHVDPMTSLRSD